MMTSSRFTMMALPAAAVLAASVVGLAGCSSGDVGVEPKIAAVDPIKNSKLQFAVGVATIN